MAISDAKRRNNDKYNAKCMQIAIRPLKEDGEMIRSAAAASGLSLQKYIVNACRAAMDPETVSLPLSGDGVSPEAVQRAAEAAGMSVNAWIIQAIKDKL